MTEKLASEIVNKIIADLTDRRGLRQAFEEIDEEIQEEIKETWIEIVMNADEV